MNHLTNWAWVAAFCFAGIRFFVEEWRAAATLAAISVSSWVAGAMLLLQLQDNYMVDSAEREYGVALVTTANLLEHYMLPVYFIIMAWVDRVAIRTLCTTSTPGYPQALLCMPALQLAAVYCGWFDLQDEYPGHIDYVLLAAGGVLVMTVSAHCVPW